MESTFTLHDTQIRVWKSDADEAISKLSAHIKNLKEQENTHESVVDRLEEILAKLKTLSKLLFINNQVVLCVKDAKLITKWATWGQT